MGSSAYSLTGFAGLVLLLPALSAAQYCASLQHQQQMLNSQILQMLMEKGPNFPPECVPQMRAFNFPAKKLRVGEPQLARRAIYEILRGLFGLFSGNLAQVWNETASRERFLNALHAQSQRIKKCFDEERSERNGPDESLNKLVLLRYFRGIETFLREKSHNPCAGNIVQLEVRTCLTYLDMLAKTMSS